MDAALGLAYLRSWRDILRIKPRDDVGPWLYRAVYNACIDQLRRNEAPSLSRRAPVEVPSGAPEGLRTVLGTLAPADRVAVVLIEREGFSVTSAARILGVTPDELATRLDVARDRLAPYVPEPSPSPKADESATEAPAATPAEDQEPALAGEAAGNGDEERDDVDAAHLDVPGDPSPAPTEDEEPAASEPAASEPQPPSPRPTRTATAPTAGAGGEHGAGPTAPIARRPAPATTTATPAGETDSAEPANGGTPSDTADTATDDGSAHPAAAAPSAGEHQRQ